MITCIWKSIAKPPGSGMEHHKKVSEKVTVCK